MLSYFLDCTDVFTLIIAVLWNVDPHRFQAGGGGSRNFKILQFGKKKSYLLIKNCNVFIPMALWRTSKVQEKPPALKEKTALQNNTFLNFFCGSFLVSWIRIWIQLTKISMDPSGSGSTSLGHCMHAPMAFRRATQRFVMNDTCYSTWSMFCGTG